eukprot:scaffold285883_cov24-Attheya_sp.AAC.1
MQAMFYSASAFNQNLCAWASKSPQLASVQRMFHEAFSCNTSQTILESGTPGAPHPGPFCFAC